MNLICDFFLNLWTNFYDKYILNVEPKIKSTIGLGMIIISLICFIYSTKNSKKGEMIGKWWLFWISSILLVVGVIYLNM